MRFKFRFSLRTLLLAVMLAVACWYFVEGNLFYTEKVIEFTKFNAGNISSGMAFVSIHRTLDRSRFCAVLLFETLPFPGWDESVQKTVHFRDRGGCWWTNKEGILYSNGNGGIQLPITAFRGVYECRRRVESISSSSSRESLGLVSHARLLDEVHWKDFQSYCRDPDIKDLSVASLKEWLLEHKM
jgi:hypothetical protein